MTGETRYYTQKNKSKTNNIHLLYKRLKNSFKFGSHFLPFQPFLLNKIISFKNTIDSTDACIASNKHYNHHDHGSYEHTKPVSPVYHKSNKDFKSLAELSPTYSLPSNRDADRESIASNGSEVSTGALQNIREQMALSLKRMRDLEEQVKIVPVLQVRSPIESPIFGNQILPQMFKNEFNHHFSCTLT